jgi:hypothetical protein
LVGWLLALYGWCGSQKENEKPMPRIGRETF